ncbi:hypothetical protein H0266_05990 [Halobacillus locisalis]|uniref:Fur-regulated basic protein A n=1 Tax=Halobacillus locisalis TaxID=220753 RepID=A0A838CS62_9BACI|nr:hypothetical protein [Halobacillus locisalis]MBA2174456.1 hypothetical protein [Halobacillus locisalis]
MNITPTYLSRGVEHRRYSLINKLELIGYTKDRVGKQTKDMTLTELEQIYINLQGQSFDG